jgi:hypothetical protein
MKRRGKKEIKEKERILRVGDVLQGKMKSQAHGTNGEISEMFGLMGTNTLN